MSWFSNLRIGPKLYFTFALIISLTITLGIFSMVKVSRENRVIKVLADRQIIVLTEQSSCVAGEVGGVAAGLAEKSESLRTLLAKFKV